MTRPKPNPVTEPIEYEYRRKADQAMLDQITAQHIAPHVQEIIGKLGEDPSRDGLLETPMRVAKAMMELTSGYHEDPAALLKTFDNDAAYEEMVLVRDIPFYSMCEHHMLPFFGYAHVGYIPNGKIVGLSKLARLTNCFARRLQVQERLTQQIADTLQSCLSPVGTMVVVEAEHFCMAMRGVQKPGSRTITSAVRGAFKEKPEARAECMGLLTKGDSK